VNTALIVACISCRLLSSGYRYPSMGSSFLRTEILVIVTVGGQEEITNNTVI